MKIVMFPQTDPSEIMRRKILELQCTAWPLPIGRSIETEVWPEDPTIHETTIALLDSAADQLVAAGTIFSKKLVHKSNTYHVFGLAEIVTHPDQRGKGYGKALVQELISYIEDRAPDLILFTCKPDLIPFYAALGFEYHEFTCLVGGTREKPFRSDMLRLATMICFCSAFAKEHRKDFTNTDVYLELRENKLW